MNSENKKPFSVTPKSISPKQVLRGDKTNRGLEGGLSNIVVEQYETAERFVDDLLGIGRKKEMCIVYSTEEF
jgi:CRISPR/Cas system endoribonuclease Cas6 (RAMP superfamily)